MTFFVKNALKPAARRSSPFWVPLILSLPKVSRTLLRAHLTQFEKIARRLDETPIFESSWAPRYAKQAFSRHSRSAKMCTAPRRNAIFVLASGFPGNTVISFKFCSKSCVNQKTSTAPRRNAQFSAQLMPMNTHQTSQNGTRDVQHHLNLPKTESKLLQEGQVGSKIAFQGLKMGGKSFRKGSSLLPGEPYWVQDCFPRLQDG